MENEFVIPVDAAHYGFKFSQAQEVKVKYHTFQTGDGSIAVTVTSVTLRPSLLKELLNPAELIHECELAARHNAESYWQEKNQTELAFS